MLCCHKSVLHDTVPRYRSLTDFAITQGRICLIIAHPRTDYSIVARWNERVKSVGNCSYHHHHQ